MGSKGGAVPNDDQLSSCPSECHIGSSSISQKADFPSFIAPDHREDDHLLLTSLKTINGIDFKSDHIELTAEESDLGSVGCNDANLSW